MSATPVCTWCAFALNLQRKIEPHIPSTWPLFFFSASIGVQVHRVHEKCRLDRGMQAVLDLLSIR